MISTMKACKTKSLCSDPKLFNEKNACESTSLKFFSYTDTAIIKKLNCKKKEMEKVEKTWKSTRNVFLFLFKLSLVGFLQKVVLCVMVSLIKPSESLSVQQAFIRELIRLKYRVSVKANCIRQIPTLMPWNSGQLTAPQLQCAVPDI